MESVTPLELVEEIIFWENGNCDFEMDIFFLLTDFPIAIFICYYVCLS